MGLDAYAHSEARKGVIEPKDRSGVGLRTNSARMLHLDGKYIRDDDDAAVEERDAGKKPDLLRRLQVTPEPIEQSGRCDENDWCLHLEGSVIL